MLSFCSLRRRKFSSLSTLLAKNMPDHTKGEVFDNEGNIVNEKTGLVYKFSASFDDSIPPQLPIIHKSPQQPPPQAPPPPPSKGIIGVNLITKIKQSSLYNLAYKMLPGLNLKEKIIYTPISIILPLLAYWKEFYIPSQETIPAISFLVVVRFLQVKFTDLVSSFLNEKIYKYDNELLKLRLNEIEMNEDGARKLLFLKEHPKIIKEYYNLLEDCNNLEEELRKSLFVKEYNCKWQQLLESASKKEKERIYQEGKEKYSYIMKGLRESLMDPSLQDKILEKSLKDLESIPAIKE